MIQLSRRSFFAGVGSLIAAPAIVRAASLMPVRGVTMPVAATDQIVSQLDILYGSMRIRPEWVYLQYDDLKDMHFALQS